MGDFKTPSNLPIGTNTQNIPPQYKIEVAEQKEISRADDDIDFSQRAQWLRAAVLGSNDGLVSVTSIMMGIGAVKEDNKSMFLAGFAGLVAGACSMAIGEFVSVSTQSDVEKAKRKRDAAAATHNDHYEPLPSPGLAALASALAFTVGGILPLFVAAFVTSYKARVPSMVGVASLALIGFGVVGAVLGRSPVFRSCVRVLIGGWMAMAVTFGITKLVHTTGGVEMGLI